MKKLIIMTAKAVKVNTNDRKYTFEIFGYDFIMDKELNMYLLEVNTNPGLEESSPLIKMLVPRMIDDALKLTIDRLFPTKYENNTPCEVEGYKVEENLWDYVTEYL
jgi:hypothetical protein